MYYRFTNRGPMSDWGHAMFSDRRWLVEGYGYNEYHLNESDTVDIWDLEDDIRSAWEGCCESEYFGDLASDSDIPYWIDFPIDDVVAGFDPEKIVDSAEWYDHEMVGWLWEFVLEPKGVMAVRTRDGAVAFDESLIHAGVNANAA